MHETLHHLSSTTTTTTGNIPNPKHPINSIPRPKHLHFPPTKQTQTISLPFPPIPPSPKEIKSPPHPSLPDVVTRSLPSRTPHSKRRSFVFRTLPLVGNKAPDFEAEAVFDQEFIKVKLSEYIGKKYVILFFYPLDFTFVCPTEITAFSDRHDEFEQLNTEILGVSIDSVFSHHAWVQTDRKSGGLGSLNYPLISDVTKSISISYGVLIPDQGIALRGLFIIDKEGVIQHSTINNLTIGRSVDETLRTLQALQYVQDNPCLTSRHPVNSLPRPKPLHFPLTPSTKQTQTISVPLPPISSPKETKSPPHPSVPSPQNTSESFQEKLLYIDSLGIDSFHCLTSNPHIIQTPLNEIKSVIDFLYSIGLTTHDLRRAISMCPDILTTPLSSTLIPAVTFLLREAHVDSHDLRHIIHRRPRLLTRSVDDTLRPTMYFLQGTIGIDDVSKWAPLLSSSVESKFIPRMEYMEKVGFSNKDTISMFRRFPSLFCYSIESNFEPKFDYFVVEMGRELRELIDFPQYFSFSLENRIKPRHQMCVEKGVVLSLPVLLKSSEARFCRRLETCCSSSIPVKTSPLWCTSISNAHFDVNVT